MHTIQRKPRSYLSHSPVHRDSFSFDMNPSSSQRPPEPEFWPDIDVYFKKDIDCAIDLINQLRAAGVKCVKTAALHDIDICLRGEHETSYYVSGRGSVSESYRTILERHAITRLELERICDHICSAGLDLVLSIYDPVGLAVAKNYGAKAVKIPSSNIVHAPLIRLAAASGLPLVLDTGRSRLTEIDRAVQWARDAGATDLLLQHSPPGPPAQPEEFHLAMLPMFGQRYGVRYGLSDHFTGLDMFPLAVALGASVIEKGVCADNTPADIDIAHALHASEVAAALDCIRRAHVAIGTPDLERRKVLAPPRDRMGLVAARDLEPGDTLDLGNTRFAFPAVGIPVEDWDDVAGITVARAVQQWQPINISDLDRSESLPRP